MATSAEPFHGEPGQSLDEVRDEAERRHILAVLAIAPNRREAARSLGISRKTLWKKLKRLGLDPGRVTER